MHHAELAWRIRTAARNALERGQSTIQAPRRDRQQLLGAPVERPENAEERDALRHGRWNDAHAAILQFVINAPQRFAIAPKCREHVTRRVVHEFPGSAHDATARGDRILAGEYDLLGYRGLRFQSPELAVDWHFDPANGRRAPRAFWTNVPFLNPACGDHKIIWELNRHQHWLALGRAYWLTGDDRYRMRMIDELSTWLDSNPPLNGINWASMLELAFRSLSWLWALNAFAESRGRDELPWSVDLLLGLDRQLAHIERNLSHYFSPNTHLLGEALALYVASRALPELASSPRRETIGRRVLVAEIDRQIAADGGHCERSAHYHLYTLDFYLLALAIARITGDPAGDDFEYAADRLASAARLLADDRGRLPH